MLHTFYRTMAVRSPSGVRRGAPTARRFSRVLSVQSDLSRQFSVVYCSLFHSSNFCQGKSYKKPPRLLLPRLPQWTGIAVSNDVSPIRKFSGPERPWPLTFRPENRDFSHTREGGIFPPNVKFPWPSTGSNRRTDRQTDRQTDVRRNNTQHARIPLPLGGWYNNIVPVVELKVVETTT